MAKHKTKDKTDLIEGVIRHALEHFDNEPGWQYIVESCPDATIAEAIGDATTTEKALANVKAFVRATAPQTAVYKLLDERAARELSDGAEVDAEVDAEVKDRLAYLTRPEPPLGIVLPTPDPDAPPAADPATPERELTELQKRLVAAVRDHARENKLSEGWNNVLHCLTDEEIAAEIGRARTEKGAIRTMQSFIESTHPES